MVTYPRYIASNRPEKVNKPVRVCICAGGGLLQYDGDVMTHTQHRWKQSKFIGTLWYQQ